LRALIFLAALTAALPPHSQGLASFDVATVKLVKGPITHSADPVIKGRTVVSIASTFRDLVEYSYGIRLDQLLGEPGWSATDHFDVEAKSEGDGVLSVALAREMMQALLADRFHLKTHRETQETAVYALVVDKAGPKFKQSAPDATGGYSVTGGEKGNHMEARRTTMEKLAQQLSYSAGRPVIDKTGLQGTYAFTLDWFPGLTPPPDLNVPAVFTALREQLGLKLEAATAPIEKLVIDHAEKPSEN
jgi:uncharacterized protein (TIGR03435 family)